MYQEGEEKHNKNPPWFDIAYLLLQWKKYK